MESTKQIQSLFLKCKTKKSNSGLQTGKKYQKPEFLTEQLERGNFINLISWISYHEAIFTWLQNCHILEHFNLPHTPCQVFNILSRNLKRKNFKWWTYILLNHSSLSSVQCECTNQVCVHQTHRTICASSSAKVLRRSFSVSFSGCQRCRQATLFSCFCVF